MDFELYPARNGNSLFHITKIGWIACFVVFVACTSPALSEVYGGGYQIGPEDVLEIGVWTEEGLQRDVLVRPDGRISFPMIGDIAVQGFTPEYVRQEIAHKLERFIPNPVVTVLIKKVAGYKVYVIGQVRKPGQYVVGGYLDVIQALALAGGLTEFASEGNIRILRRDGAKVVVIPFDYSDVKKGQKLSQNIILKTGDTVVVQ